MSQPIMVACDLHDKTMVLKLAVGTERPEKMTLANTTSGRQKLIAELRQRAAALEGAKVMFAYEASGLGFGLYDELSAAGIECHVLAPTCIARSVRQRRNKTDERDADQILEVLRGHVLAGNRLPQVWIPDHQTRDDRELLRMRLDVAEKITRIKAQVRTLLKRNHTRRPEGLGDGWTVPFRAWLAQWTKAQGGWKSGVREALASLLRQLESLEKELKRLNKAVLKLASEKRYAATLDRMVLELKGVGYLTALVFLTEVGDLARFANRRQIAAYLGLAPAADESGDRNDAKGHITHQGPSRVRKLLCQAVWSRVRTDPEEAAVYARLVAKNPKHKKIAIVAGMRRLAIRMWHSGQRAAAAQEDGGRDHQAPRSLPPPPHPPSPLLCCP